MKNGKKKVQLCTVKIYSGPRGNKSVYQEVVILVDLMFVNKIRFLLST